MGVSKTLLQAAAAAATPLVQKAAEKAVDLAKDPEFRGKVAKAAWEHRDQIEGAAKAAAPVAQKAVEKATDAGTKAADSAKGAAKVVTKKAREAADSANEARQAAAEKRAQEKEVADARQQLLQGATARMAATDFEAQWNAATGNASDGGATALPLKSPGYFAIATYKGKPNSGKLYDYREVFVARSEDMGQSIHDHLRGRGNPDVYADMKYKQPMLVFAFPDFDLEDDNEETLRQFVLALGANESYNARK